MLKAQKLNEDAKLPVRHSNSAGYDLYAAEDIFIEPNTKKSISTGLAISIPNSHFGRIVGRSGITLKTHLNVLEGIIDPDYRGEIKIMVHNTKIEHKHYVKGYATIDKPFESDIENIHLPGTYKIRKGDKIAQLILTKLEANNLGDFIEVDELDETERGNNGFGSSGV